MVFRSLLTCSLLVFHLLLLAKADDSEDKRLFDGVNSYRASLNLTKLTENKNAACLADQIAEQFKDQRCTNTTGANTVPGTENQFPNYPNLLAHCNLNISNTRDGMVMPACVPGLVPSAVLSNFTQSQYNEYLNDSQYVGVGIASENDWIVVVLSTNTSAGSFQTDHGDGSDHNGAAGSSVRRLVLNHHFLTVCFVFLVFLMMS